MPTDDTPDLEFAYQSPNPPLTDPVTPTNGETQTAIQHAPPLAKRRPRWWTPLAVSGLALFLCIVVSAVMAVVAVVVVVGPNDIAKLSDPKTLEAVMASRLGFCLLVIPPQLMLLLTTAVAAFFSPVAFRERLSLVKGHWPVWTWFAAAAAAPLVGLISTVVLSQFMTESDNLKMMTSVFRGHSESGFLIPLALIIGLTPAICEEILFRGYVQTRLSRSFGPIIGVIVASVMFAAFHMDLVHSVAVLPLGFFLGFVVARSGSIFPAMLAHFVNNAISIVGVAFAPAGETDVLATPAILVSLSILAAGMIGSALVIFATLYFRPPAKTQLAETELGTNEFATTELL